MSDPIISIDMIQRKARAAFARGAGRDDHGFNWHSGGAVEIWQKEWDRCMLGWYAQQQEAGALAEVSPP